MELGRRPSGPPADLSAQPPFGPCRTVRAGLSSRRIATDLFFNPFEPGFDVDPYPQYARLRQVGVLPGPLDTVFAFRHREVEQLVTDPALSIDEANAFRTEAVVQRRSQFGAWVERGARSMLNVDPPNHTRLRRAVSRSFTPNRVRERRASVEQAAASLLDAAAAKERDGVAVDLVADVATPLPCFVISELLGFPRDDWGTLRRWSHSLTKALEPMVLPDDLPEITDAGNSMLAYFTAIIDEKRRAPSDDLLGALCALDDTDAQLTPDEVVDQVLLLYIAGHETVANLLGNSWWHLLQRPDDYALLTSGAVTGADVAEEMLRFDSPIQFVRRATLDDYVIGDTELVAGQLVLACVASANHDTDVFGPDAEQLHLRRGSTKALSFGVGIHFCLGAALARLEADVALRAFAERFPTAAIDAAAAVWGGRVMLRGLDALPAVLQP